LLPRRRVTSMTTSSATVREDAEDLDPEPGLLHAEEAEEEDKEAMFMLTDEGAGTGRGATSGPGPGTLPDGDWCLRFSGARLGGGP
jgi:hypothetical protein